MGRVEAAGHVAEGPNPNARPIPTAGSNERTNEGHARTAPPSSSSSSSSHRDGHDQVAGGSAAAPCRAHSQDARFFQATRINGVEIDPFSIESPRAAQSACPRSRVTGRGSEAKDILRHTESTSSRWRLGAPWRYGPIQIDYRNQSRGFCGSLRCLRSTRSMPASLACGRHLSIGTAVVPCRARTGV